MTEPIDYLVAHGGSFPATESMSAVRLDHLEDWHKELTRLRTERSGLQSNIDYYREMIDDIRTLTDRAATDRTYDGNLIDDIRAIIGSPVSGMQK